MNERELTLSEMINDLGQAATKEDFDHKFNLITKLVSASYSLCQSAFIVGLDQGISCCSDLIIEIDTSERLLKRFRHTLSKGRDMNNPEFRSYLLFGKLLILIELLNVALVKLEEIERHKGC